MLTPSFAFAVLCFVLLLLFFSGLPNLKICELPHSLKKNEPDRQNRLAVMMVTILYAICAFWNLGNTRSPQTFVPMEGRDVILRLPENCMPDRLVLFPGVGQGNYSIEYSNDAEGWYPQKTFNQDHVAVLKWQFLPMDLNEPVNFLRIHCTSGTPWLGEIALWDPAGNAIAAVSSIPELTDEGMLVPSASDFLNSTYFDEIYHARTAWEHLHGIWPYEISHPPLGKEILSLGILLFGMTPFGWRFSGTLFGILMLPAMYRFLKRLYGTGRVPVLGTVLLAAGFLHYVQTRIATIDSYAVFFILLMTLFMYLFVTEGRLRDLALCGVCFGLGAASKWTCLYAGAGLAFIWAIWVIDGIQKKTLNARGFVKNVLFCVVFFVLVPALIYYLSYLPYGIARGKTNLFSAEYLRIVLDNQSYMFKYHSGLVATHPYSSYWYQWLLDIRPILYYLDYLPDGRHISFGAFVNPVLCWGGLLSLFVLVFLLFVRRDRRAGYILLCYLAQLLPWVLVPRLTFAYHYFPCTPFLALSLGECFQILRLDSARGRWAVGGFILLSLLVFALFYPNLAGFPVAANGLRSWLPTWPF